MRIRRSKMADTILGRAQLRAPTRRDEKARFRGVTMLPSRGEAAVVESFTVQ